jgi:hypothetical protein
MKKLTKLTILSVCLITALCTAAHAQSKGTAEPPDKRFEKAGTIPVYDAAKDETNVYMLPIGLMPPREANLATLGLMIGSLTPPEGVMFNARFAYPGKTFVAPQQITLRLVSTKRGERRFSDSDKLTLIADTGAVAVGSAAFTLRNFKSDHPKPGTDYVTEILEAPIAVEDFKRLAAAKKVEVMVGGSSWKINESRLKALRRLASLFGDAK